MHRPDAYRTIYFNTFGGIQNNDFGDFYLQIWDGKHWVTALRFRKSGSLTLHTSASAFQQHELHAQGHQTAPV